ncbi:MAG: twin-arginine translocation signal domain-containing protein, partial [Comamonadaceae bacterium]
MTTTRRELLRTLGAGGAAAAMSGCSPLRPSQVPSPPLLSAEDQALRERFAVLRGGGQLVVDSLTPKEGVNIFDESGRTYYAKSGLGPRAGGIFFYGASFGVPRTLRAIWRTGEDIRPDIYRRYSGGTIVGDYTVPVASRIPDDLLQDLRSNPGGGFRLKIRLHDDGVLIGWDIERRPGFDPKKRDQWGEAVYVGPVHSFAGGDFREAEIFNGKPVRMG